MANFTINEKSTNNVAKAFWMRFNGLHLVVGFTGNFTKTRKLVVAREILDFAREQGTVLPELTEDELITQALRTIEQRGSVYKDLTIEHGSTTEIATGVVRPYTDIRAEYSASNGNSPAKVKFITIG